MKLQFLCGAHRMSLSQNPSQANNCWQDSFDSGLVLFEQGAWKESLPYLGCAFETAEIMLSQGAVEAESGYEIFTASALLLMEAFSCMEYLEESQQIHMMASARLTREVLSNAAVRPIIATHIERLNEQVRIALKPVPKQAPKALASGSGRRMSVH